MAKTNKMKGLRKFILLAAVLAGYCAYAIHSFGLAQGSMVTALSWSFFVFCTPIADAGFLLDFPTRLITGIRMFFSELFVWAAAAALNLSVLLINPGVYQKTELLRLFHKILTTPWPLGLIIALSAVGTYTTVLFDDNVFDVAISKNRSLQLSRDRLKLLIMAGIFAVTLILYVILLNLTNTSIKIF